MNFYAVSTLLPRDAVVVLQRAAEKAFSMPLHSIERERVVNEAIRWVKSRYPQYFKQEALAL